jgi:hypothetical protein
LRRIAPQTGALDLDPALAAAAPTGATRTDAQVSNAVDTHRDELIEDVPELQHMELEMELEALIQSEYASLAGLDFDGAVDESALVVVEHTAPSHQPSANGRNDVNQWLASLIVAREFHLFASSALGSTRIDVHPSLLLTSTIDPSGAASVALEIVVWDDAKLCVGRRTRLDKEYLNFTPKPSRTQHWFVDYSDSIQNGDVKVLLGNMGARMVRRSGRFRPVVPWQALLFHQFCNMVYTGGCDLDIAGLQCIVCGGSGAPRIATGDHFIMSRLSI